jgi:uncharacterized OB-fold protein
MSMASGDEAISPGRRDSYALFLDVGRVRSRFFIELKDRCRIMGNLCPKCRVVWVLPRLRCPECHVEIDEQSWIEVGAQGTLRHFTMVR